MKIYSDEAYAEELLPISKRAELTCAKRKGGAYAEFLIVSGLWLTAARQSGKVLSSTQAYSIFKIPFSNRAMS
jgi:hypothetical protein